MKSLFTLMTFGLLSQSLFAVDLLQATNQQLLDEVSRRMGGSTPSTSSAIVTYICDNSYLTISTIGPVSSKEEKIYFGNKTACLEQASPLAKTKSKIYDTTLAAICDNSYMLKFALFPTGELKKLDSIYFGNKTACLEQAKTINEN